MIVLFWPKRLPETLSFNPGSIAVPLAKKSSCKVMRWCPENKKLIMLELVLLSGNACDGGYDTVRLLGVAMGLLYFLD